MLLMFCKNEIGSIAIKQMGFKIKSSEDKGVFY